MKGSLKFRLLGFMLAGMVLSYGLLAWLVLKREEQALRELQRRRSAVAASELRRAVKELMVLKKDPSVLESLVEDHATGVQVALFGPDLRLRYGSVAVNIPSDMRTQPRDMEFPTSEGVLYLRPLLNERPCRGCHKDRGPLRGVLAVRVSFQEARELAHGTAKRIGLFVLVIAAPGALALVLLLRRMVFSPLGELARGAQALGEGRLQTRLSISSPQEMAVLAEGFNRMAQRLEQLYEGMEAEVRRRTRDLRVIARLSSEVFKATIPLRETLQAFLGSITQELGYRFASLCLIAPKDGTLRQEYTAGDVSGTSAQVLELSSSHPFAQAVLKAEPLVCEAPEAGLEGLGGRVAVAPVVAHQRRRCREVNACRFRGCPAYGSPDDRCWLLEGTLCRSPKAVRGRPKIYGCVHCKAFPVFGVLVAAKEEVAPQDLDTLRILASIIASVLETHKLIEAAREDIQELVRLHDVAVEYLQYTSLRELLPSVLGAACRFASAPAGALWLREPQGLSLQAVQGLKEELLPARLSVEGPWLRQAFEAGSLLQPPEPHAIHQVSQVMLYHGFNYVALLPLKSKEEPVGLLLLWKKDDFPLSDSQRAIMMLLATQAASAVQMLRLHEGLRESEEKFRSLAEQSPNMIFINRAGRVVYANRRCEEVMGYRREEFYSPDFDFLALVAPESRELVEAYFSRHMRGQECPPYEYTLLTKDGRRIHAINTTRLIQYEGRQAILGIVTDITERKEMEEELRSLLAALRAEKEFSEAIFQSTASGLMVLDAEARVLRINQAGSEILGLRPEELLGRRITELYPALEAMLDIQPTGQEVEITLPRGQRRPVGFSTSPFIDAEGQERGLIVVFRDLTEIKRLQAELRKKQHFEAVGKVVSGVAHEVRNPLFAISSIAQVLEREVEDAKHKGLLQVLLKEAYRIKNLIEELLLYSRPARLNIVPTELEFFLERLRQYIRLKKDIALEVDVPPELKVQADQDKLTQVFLNLLDNALEAGATRVSIRAQRRKDVVEIVLQDNGSGIQGDDLEKVFEPFFTTKKEGTGLGLSICRKLVEEHGGSLRLESGPGGGCAVLMRLPLAP